MEEVALPSFAGDYIQVTIVQVQLVLIHHGQLTHG
jgi:hypothetical protein